MMQIYIDALRESSTGSSQYIIEDGLSITRTSNPDTVLALLRHGGTVKAKCVNGVLEETWQFYSDSLESREKPAVEAVMAKTNLQADWRALRICTQAFFDSSYEREALYMYMDLWKVGDVKSDTFYITPKDKVAEPKGFRVGQEKAQEILDILSHFHVRQDDLSLFRKLTALQNGKNTTWHTPCEN